MTEQVQMSAEERAEFEAFKAEKEKKAQAARRKSEREEYQALVDDELKAAAPELINMSQQLLAVKRTVFQNFQTILRLKTELFGVPHDQFTHTFTSSDSAIRMIIGVNSIDAYLDTVESGIAMVKEYISSLAKDEESQALVNAVLRLLSKDQSGNLKASRVLQLEKMAEESGNEKFIEGVKVIREAYKPTASKSFIRLEVKGKNGGWQKVPLSLTDVDEDSEPEIESK